MNFWHKLNSGFYALAPMADVTDAAFREMFVKYGKPDVIWTEFVSADGLFLAPEQGRDFWLPTRLRAIAKDHGVAGDNPLLKDLIFSDFTHSDLGKDAVPKSERPIVAQFFSRDPDRMRRAARLAVDLGFDGIDINMGCPAKVIVRQGAGCAMIKEPVVAVKVIQATIGGAAGKIPVSVKTRTGFSSDQERDSWLQTLLETDIAALTLHARTRKDMSRVPARWENIAYLVELRDKLNPQIRILGNGDVADLEEGDRRLQETGADGIMIGRGIFGNPWRFNRHVQKEDLSDQEVFSALLEHSRLFDKYLSDTKNFALMRKHYKSYLRFSGFPKEFKQKLFEVNNYAELADIAAQIQFDSQGGFVTI